MMGGRKRSHGRTGGMGPWVKCLLQKPVDLSFDSQHWRKNLPGAVCTSEVPTVRGGGRQLSAAS